MENATKALLIAAAVLVVILIIALGMQIFKSSSGAHKSAIESGQSIANESKLATNEATSAMNGLTDAFLR